jgi:GDPmannose 4,6-dehydratase
LEKPDEFVVATGVKHSVREFVQIAFDCLDMDWKMYIEENNSLIKRKRKPLVGDSSKLMSLTGWQPSVSFTQMIKLLLKDEEAEIL